MKSLTYYPGVKTTGEAINREFEGLEVLRVAGSGYYYGVVWKRPGSEKVEISAVKIVILNNTTLVRNRYADIVAVLDLPRKIVSHITPKENPDFREILQRYYRL